MKGEFHFSSKMEVTNKQQKLTIPYKGANKSPY